MSSQIHSMAIKNEAEASRGDVQQNELLDKHPITYGGDPTSNKRISQQKRTVKLVEY